MTIKEKDILKQLVESADGVLLPADFINGIAKRDRRTVENLVSKGYVEEVPVDKEGLRGTYKINFYRATEKGLMEFSHFLTKMWYKFKTQVPLWVGVFSIVVGISSIVISSMVSFKVPANQKTELNHDEIQAVYKNLVINQDIVITNLNAINAFASSTEISDLPESFIENNISDSARRTIVDRFGLIQFRFFLYYIQQTALLNSEILQLRNNYISLGPTSTNYVLAKNSYLKTITYLSGEKFSTKFNYLKDSECIKYIFEQSFNYLDVDGRGKLRECSNDSLNRLYYYFGFLPDDTPNWLIPKLKNALDERGVGLGEKYIGDDKGKKIITN